MPKTPNYDFERRERDRAKAAKKAEKLAAKQAAKERGDAGEENTDPSRQDAATEAQ